MKKVSYSMRKDTAEKRLRIKGRFIKKETQQDILQRIFADEQISNTNAQSLNRNLNELINSPNPKGEQLLQAMEPPSSPVASTAAIAPPAGGSASKLQRSATKRAKQPASAAKDIKTEAAAAATKET